MFRLVAINLIVVSNNIGAFKAKLSILITFKLLLVRKLLSLNSNRNYYSANNEKHLIYGCSSYLVIINKKWQNRFWKTLAPNNNFFTKLVSLTAKLSIKV